MEEQEGNEEERQSNEREKFVPRLDDWKNPMIKDVIGTKKLSSTLEHVVENICHPSLFKMAGVKPQKTYLFYGPPGLGKTYAVKAVRNEAQRRLGNVVWSSYDIGTHGTAYINMGARQVNEYFKQMRKMADKGFTVISFLDEVDDVLKQRGGGSESHGEDQKVTNEFMKNLNDINQYEADITIFMATNYEKALDSAAVRSGRVDLLVPFEKPSTYNLVRAYRLYANKINDKAIYKVFPRFAMKQAGLASEGFAYSDVQSVMQRAARNVVYSVLEDEREIITPPKVSLDMLLEVIAKHKEERDILKENKRRIGFV